MTFKKKFNRKILKKKKTEIKDDGVKESFVNNKKIRNATITIYDKITYRSKLEAYCAQMLTENNIPFEYEKKTYTLVEKFVSNTPFYQEIKVKDKVTKVKSKVFRLSSPNVRAITYTPDFVGEGWIIETKGLMTDTAQLKQKMFKLYLSKHDTPPIVFVPRTKGQVLFCVNELKKLLSNEKSD